MLRGPTVLALALAVAAWAGASLPLAVPPWVGVVALVVAWSLRNRVLVVVAVALTASGLAAAAWAGLAPPEPAAVSDVVTLVSDPVPAPLGAGWVAEVRLSDGTRLEATHPDPSSPLASLLAGERIEARGRVEPHAAGHPWLVARHLRGRLVVQELGTVQPGHVLSRTANGFRRTLERGAAPLPADRRSLLAGLLLGDDRAQAPEDQDAFQAAGLTHLLAVSGQNVAFVLALVAPLVRRLGLRGGVLLVLAVLVVFAWTTRCEPSVLRAVAMAGLATVTSAAGRRTTGLQVLGLAVAGLVLVDPLLVHALGFQLSVLASAGILVAARPVTDRLPGPRWAADAAGVTVAAQAAVAPLLVHTFDGVPVLALVTNVLVAPAVGPLTAWGLTAGYLAGLVPGAAPVLHVPTHLLLAWVDGVAHAAVRLPSAQLRSPHLVVLGVLALIGFLGRRRRFVRVIAVVSVLLVLLHPLVVSGATTSGETALGAGAVLRQEGGVSVVVVDGRARAGPILEALRLEGVRRLDLVVARTPAAAEALDALLDRYGDVTVLAPTTIGDVEVTVLSSPQVVQVGPLHLEVLPMGVPPDRRLEVTARVPAGGAEGRW